MSTLDASTGLTCVSCRLVFQTAELQRDHYRTDWHRYNLKRQVSELPPVTFDQFNDKVQAFKTDKVEKKKEADDTASIYCKVCHKQMKSRNAFDNHILSNKHKEREENLGKPKKGPKQPRKKTQPKTVEESESSTSSSAAADVEMAEEVEDDGDSSGWETDDGKTEENGEFKNVEFDESQALPVTSCLFCPQTKPTKEEILSHMHFHHGFLIPDRKYLSDETGLLEYLGLKVGAGRCCIFCPDIRSRFASIDACQAHMRDKEHCRVSREPKDMLEYAEYYDYSPMYENDQEPDSEVLYDDGWTLTLPSGAKIGHRSLMIFYRQKLRPVDAVKRDSGRVAIDRARGIVPALAWTNTTGVVAARQQARDMKYIERFRRRVDTRTAVWSSKLFKTRGRVGDN